jgi:hypothetical protein
MNPWLIGIGVFGAILLVVLLIAMFSSPPSNPDHSEDDTCSYTADTSDAPESEAGVELTVGTDGAGVDLSLGNGLGIDLSDGSLTIHAGGVRFDTDGDSPTFKI